MVKAAARALGKGLACLFLALGLFMLAAWIGSSIPRNPGWKEVENGVEILVETNGVHTALVIPAVTAQKDWRGDFPASDVANSGRPYTHVSFSWGEREVFLHTETWADLSPLTVLRVAGIGGDALLHVAHYVRPAPADDIRPVRLSVAQYRALVRRIEAYVPSGKPRRTYPGYDEYDVFYDAPDRYNLGKTCNQWTSDLLAAAGVRTGLWTPFAGGVMKWLPAIGHGPQNPS